MGSSRLSTQYQQPGYRGSGGEVFDATKQKFEVYLRENFWNCLFEENQWPRQVIARVIEMMHWEAIPSVFHSMIQVFTDAQGRRRTRMVEDVVFLLKQLGNVNHFAAGIYHGDKELMRKIFDWIETLRKEAFREDRLEKLRWYETQQELIEGCALFLRGLSRIGAHPAIRHVFWYFPHQGISEQDTNVVIEEFRKRLKFTKKTMMQQRVEHDKLPHINQTNEELRFDMFLWLLKFSFEVNKFASAIYFDDQDYRSTAQRRHHVHIAVFTALQKCIAN
ncbi:hypothetical protein RFI_10354 [Reticulomyxa filosa]|uniref:Uncharacterized protein n=1 Tax=Reticulomyxa filosa TaxID=46433 RepID=X6NM29_RETFI|nr:hypothetical protein RFI_10354 [Reticulomyxa filosa]|eukprot:ETO26779.1 hypothetical protein RFI_10354 [Reticulomyxa filosa]